MAPEPVGYPDLIRPTPAASLATVPPQTFAPSRLADDEQTLSAIRAIMRSLPEADSAGKRPAPPQGVDVQRKVVASGTFGLLFARALSHQIAWSTLILALPVGLAQAKIYHLNGGDLADWD